MIIKYQTIEGQKIIIKQRVAKLIVAIMLIVKLKSETLKNVHLKPEIKYTTGLNIDNFCQNKGSIEIE